MRQREGKRIKSALSLLSAAAITAGCIGLSVPAAEPKADEQTQFLFNDTSYSFEERAADIVSRLTLEEKAAQIGNNNPAISRLGISNYDYWKEGLHGIANLDAGQTATSFPYSLAMAATWDKELMEEVGTAISDEARGYNNQGLRGLSYWSPTINLARDPRWGRNHESYGEDVYLTSALGTGFVDGYMGNNDGVTAADGTKYLKVIATLKHYAANNREDNRDFGTSNMDEQYLREYYTRTFKNIVRNTDIRQVMSSYNRVNEIPASASTHLLDDLLRKTFGFRGYVTSDCGAIKDMVDDHKWVPAGSDHVVTPEEATLYGLTAGCDMDCGFIYPQNAVSAVRSGLLSEDVIDQALLRIFTQRMKTGEFDPAEKVPYRSEAYSYKNQVESKEHVQLSADASDQAIVLLKNEKVDGADKPILPLNASASQKVVVVGDLASQNLLGGYSGTPSKENISTPLQGIESVLGHDVTYINGSGTASDKYVCNSRNLKLTKADGSEVILTPGDAQDFSNCQTENNKANVGYITSNAYYAYPNVDITNVTKVSIETSGGGDTLQGTVEIHMDSPDGMILTKIRTQQTGSWTNYQYFDNTESVTLGGYTNKKLYVIFVPDTPATTEIKFSDTEKADIQAADVVIACIGSNGGDSTEGHDRSSIAMPRNQGLLVKELARLNPKTVTYIQSVGALEIGQFKDDVPAILWTCFNGQDQGNAMARVLFGLRNPGAKLPFTWYADNSQLPTMDDYNLYDESYKNGGWTYQYFTGDVDYPFGYGLSYSQFSYGNMQISKDTATPNDTVQVSVDVTNTGTGFQRGDVNGDGKVQALDALMALKAATNQIALTVEETNRGEVDEKPQVSIIDALMILQTAAGKIELPNTADGEEVVQLYVSVPDANGKQRPFKQLKSFEKVAIKAGETKTVTLDLDLADCYFWDDEAQKNVYDTGDYTLLVGSSSEKEDGLTGALKVTGEYQPKLTIVTAKADKVVLNAARPDKVLTTQLTATMSDDSFYDLEAEGVEIAYESSDSTIASVDDEGTVTAKKAGLTTITAKVTIDGVTKEDSFPVAVIDQLKIDNILLDGEKMDTFDANVTEYYYPVAGDTAPTVTVPEMGDQITAKITQADSISGTAKVEVSNGKQTITYTIHFRPQSDQYVVAKFSDAGGRYTASKGTLNVPWTIVDGGQPVDLMTHRLSDLSLNFTVTLQNSQKDLKDEDAFKGGYVKLRSVDKNGENSRGWGVSPLKLQSGVNYVSIPLSRISETTQTGTIDWTQINQFRLYIDSTNSYEGPFTMILQDIMIVDNRYDGTRQHLQALVDATVNEADYTPTTYKAYAEAKQAAQTVLDNESATEEQITEAIQAMQTAKEKLERRVDKTALQEAIDKPIGDESVYTEDSVARYKAVLAEAQKVLENENATQDEVDTALRNVNTARGKLKKPNTQPVLATFGDFNREYSASAGNWLYGTTLYADWHKADQTPLDLEGDRTGLYLIMNMTFNAPADTDFSQCWSKITIKLRSLDKNGENNYGWDLKPGAQEVVATATPGKFKILIPLTKEKDNSTGSMDWSEVEKIITTTEINGVGDYRVLAGKNDLTMTLSDTQIVDSTLFDLAAWKKQ